MKARSIRRPPLRGSRLAADAHLGAFAKWLATGLWRVAQAVAGFAIAYASLVLAALGVFRHPPSSSMAELLALGGLGLLLIARLFARLQPTTGAREPLEDLELGTLFIGASFVLIEMTGGPAGLLYPLVYALVAFLVAFHAWPHSAYFLVLILGSEAAILWQQPQEDGWRMYLSHASFILLFGLLYALFLRTEIVQRKRSMTRELETHLDTMEREARDFRLTSGMGFESRELSQEELMRRRRMGSITAIRESLYNVLAVAERALLPHSVALLWLSADDKHLRLKELRSSSDNVVESPIPVGEGLLGAIAKRREPLVLTNLRPGQGGLVYYTRAPAVTDFAGVPVLEGQHLRGVLVADRIDGRPFDDADVAVLNTIAGEVVRAIQVERIFSDMDREKYQKERFYQASQAFNSALGVDQVAKVAVDAARRMAQVELAAVAVATERDGIMRLAALDWSEDSRPRGVDLDAWRGLELNAEHSLVGAAIKTRCALPHGTARAASQHVFSADIPINLPAVKVLPLLWKDNGVGALVLGSERPDFLTFDLQEMVQVVADHAAIAIANAQLYERMERMATTDGLTGLVNHRRFQELFDEHLARAERYGNPLSLILLDIDHFKSVNDTYGHPVGDKVLQRVARCLAHSARRTDVVARYGGEEFAVLMEQSDANEAFMTAERIRLAVAAESFQSDNGSFKCTLSLGIGTYPHHATEKASLTELADQALYQAKRNGRNRAIISGQGHTARRHDAQ